MTQIKRQTRETNIELQLALHGGTTDIDSGIGFFDHMLTALALHGGLGLRLRCQGDLQVDAHHTVEDCGIVLGQALDQALADKSGIARFGFAKIPMDESQAEAVLDVSGRAFLRWDARFSQSHCGQFETCLCEEFFRALAMHAKLTLHVRLCCGGNAHHEAEALFKATAHALRAALCPQAGLLSTKGVL